VPFACKVGPVPNGRPSSDTILNSAGGNRPYDLCNLNGTRSVPTTMTPRIAIIGSGMAGLSAAWMLSQREVHVSIFEKSAKPGLAAHSRDFSELLGCTTEPVMGDIPSRMINESLWPGVCKLYEQAGIATVSVDADQSFYNNDGTRFRASLPYAATDVLAAMARPSHAIIVNRLNHFRKFGTQWLAKNLSSDLNFGDFLQDEYNSPGSASFLKEFLFPALSATVFTCPVQSLKQYPATLVLDALQKISGGNTLLRTKLGSGDAAAKLLVDVDCVYFSTPVEQVVHEAEGVVVVSSNGQETFDHVVVATQANHVSGIVRGREEETQLLSRFGYCDVPVALHTDPSLMPSLKKDRATFNFDSAPDQPSCTVWMNRFHSSWPEGKDIFQTIFPGEVDPQSVISCSVLQRPLVNAETAVLWKSLDEIHQQSGRRIWYVGSYAAAGVPLLESACRSSENVVERIVGSRSAVSPAAK